MIRRTFFKVLGLLAIGAKVAPSIVTPPVRKPRRVFYVDHRLAFPYKRLLPGGEVRYYCNSMIEATELAQPGDQIIIKAGHREYPLLEPIPENHSIIDAPDRDIHFRYGINGSWVGSYA